MSVHSDSIKKICLICFKKCSKLRQINKDLENIIRSKFIINYEKSDKYPEKICATCQLIISQHLKYGASDRNVVVFDYETKKIVPRLNGLCNCYICLAAVVKGRPKKASKGRPKSKHAPRQVSSLAVQQSETGHSLQQVIRIKQALNLSQNQTRVLSRELRTTESGYKKNRVVKGLHKMLHGVSHSMDDLFKVVKVGGHSGVICHNLVQFLERIKTHRGIPNPYVQIGIDSGGGSLKVTMTIRETPQEGQGKSGKIYKDSGVKKIFLIGEIVGAAETHSIVKELWNKLRLNEFYEKQKFYIAADLKMVNDLVGISTFSATNPCCYCTATQLMIKNGDAGFARTLARIIRHYRAWRVVTNMNPKEARDWESCVNEPVLNFELETKLVEFMIIPELHLFTGIIAHVYDALKRWDADLAEKWLEKIGLSKTTDFGARFTGNSAKLLMKKAFMLKEMCEDKDIEKYIVCFSSFEAVVQDCFGQTLHERYQESIKTFIADVKAADISVTVKIHILEKHVCEFIEIHQLPLGIINEQASEHVHSDFKVSEKRYHRNELSKENDMKHLRAVLEYNAFHA